MWDEDYEWRFSPEFFKFYFLAFRLLSFICEHKVRTDDLGECETWARTCLHILTQTCTCPSTNDVSDLNEMGHLMVGWTVELTFSMSFPWLSTKPFLVPTTLHFAQTTAQMILRERISMVRFAHKIGNECHRRNSPMEIAISRLCCAKLVSCFVWTKTLFTGSVTKPTLDTFISIIFSLRPMNRKEKKWKQSSNSIWPFHSCCSS